MRISRSDSEGSFDFEITRVDCISLPCSFFILSITSPIRATKTSIRSILKYKVNIRAYRGLTDGFLLLRNFSVAISVSPPVCFILVLILISMFLR